MEKKESYMDMDYFNKIADEITEDTIKKKAEWIDNLLIERLKFAGHEFDNRKDLEEFVKKRCRIEIRGYNNKMFVDDILTAEWIDDPSNIFSNANMMYLFGFGI